MGTLKLQTNGPVYINTVIGTLAVDGWTVTFGTVRRGLGGMLLSPLLAVRTKYKSLPVNGQCTNFILLNVALLLPVPIKGLKTCRSLSC